MVEDLFAYIVLGLAIVAIVMGVYGLGMVNVNERRSADLSRRLKAGGKQGK
jgi:hypothetical protein